jgi:hypothetical protein
MQNNSGLYSSSSCDVGISPVSHARSRGPVFEDLAASVAEPDRGHQRLIDVGLLFVQCARGGDRVLQAVEQIRRGVGVSVAEVGQVVGCPDGSEASAG